MDDGFRLLLDACVEVLQRLPAIGERGGVQALPMQGLLSCTHALMSQPCMQMVPVGFDGRGGLLLSWRGASLYLFFQGCHLSLH
jgi:hypothetical protein